MDIGRTTSALVAPTGPEPRAGIGVGDELIPRHAPVTHVEAAGFALRAGLSEAERADLFALDYPAPDDQFQRVLAGMGLTPAGLMERMGSSP